MSRPDPFDDFAAGRGPWAEALRGLPPFEPPARMARDFHAALARLPRPTPAFEPPPALQQAVLADIARQQAAQQPRRDALLREVAGGAGAAEALGAPLGPAAEAWLQSRAAAARRQAEATRPAAPRLRPWWRFAAGGAVALLALGVSLRLMLEQPEVLEARPAAVASAERTRPEPLAEGHSAPPSRKALAEPRPQAAPEPALADTAPAAARQHPAAATGERAIPAEAPLRPEAREVLRAREAAPSVELGQLAAPPAPSGAQAGGPPVAEAPTRAVAPAAPPPAELRAPARKPEVPVPAAAPAPAPAPASEPLAGATLPAAPAKPAMLPPVAQRADAAAPRAPVTTPSSAPPAPSAVAEGAAPVEAKAAVQAAGAAGRDAVHADAPAVRSPALATDWSLSDDPVARLAALPAAGRWQLRYHPADVAGARAWLARAQPQPPGREVALLPDPAQPRGWLRLETVARP